MGLFGRSIFPNAQNPNVYIWEIPDSINQYTRCVQNILRILNCRGLRIFDFRFFCGVVLVLMLLIYADKYAHFECSVNFWQHLCLHVFWLVLDFCLFQNMDQRICIKFCWKTKLSARTYSECWLWHMVKLPWTEATFIGGTKCFPRTENMWTTKSVPDARARQQQTKKLMKWRK